MMNCKLDVLGVQFGLSISPAYSPFSDRVGLPLHNISSSGVLIMKSIGAASTICVGCNIK